MTIPNNGTDLKYWVRAKVGLDGWHDWAGPFDTLEQAQPFIVSLMEKWLYNGYRLPHSVAWKVEAGKRYWDKNWRRWRITVEDWTDEQVYREGVLFNCGKTYLTQKETRPKVAALSSEFRGYFPEDYDDRYIDTFPFPVEYARFGIGDPIDPGTVQDINGPFAGAKVYVGSELEYPCNGTFSAQPANSSLGCNALFTRPETPLPDDDGYSKGVFFVGVEVKFRQIGRRSGAVMQAQSGTGRAIGQADMVYASWLSIRADIGNISAYLPSPPYENPAPDTTPFKPRSGVFAETGKLQTVFMYRGDGSIVSTSGTMPNDSNAALFAYTGPPGDSRTCVANPFQEVNTEWTFRAVYIIRRVRGVGPEGTEGTRTRIGEGGELYYSAENSGEFTYCPHTNGAALTVSEDATITGINGKAHEHDANGGVLEVWNAPATAPTFRGVPIDGYTSQGEGGCVIWSASDGTPTGRNYVWGQRLFGASQPNTVLTYSKGYLTGLQNDYDGTLKDGGGAVVVTALHGTPNTTGWLEPVSSFHFAWSACPGASHYYIVVRETGGLRQFISLTPEYDVPMLTADPAIIDAFVYPSFPAEKQGATNRGGSCPRRGLGEVIQGGGQTTYQPITTNYICARTNGLAAFLYTSCGTFPPGRILGNQGGFAAHLDGPTTAELHGSEWRGCNGPTQEPPPGYWKGRARIWIVQDKDKIAAPPARETALDPDPDYDNAGGASFMTDGIYWEGYPAELATVNERYWFLLDDGRSAFFYADWLTAKRLGKPFRGLVGFDDPPTADYGPYDNAGGAAFMTDENEAPYNALDAAYDAAYLPTYVAVDQTDGDNAGGAPFMGGDGPLHPVWAHGPYWFWVNSDQLPTVPLVPGQPANPVFAPQDWDDNGDNIILGHFTQPPNGLSAANQKAYRDDPANWIYLSKSPLAKP